MPPADRGPDGHSRPAGGGARRRRPLTLGLLPSAENPVRAAPVLSLPPELTPKGSVSTAKPGRTHGRGVPPSSRLCEAAAPGPAGWAAWARVALGRSASLFSSRTKTGLQASPLEEVKALLRSPSATVLFLNLLRTRVGEVGSPGNPSKQQHPRAHRKRRSVFRKNPESVT